MTTVIVCPDCQRKLRIPEAALGSSFRCPACKTLIAPDSEAESSSAPSSIKRTRSPRSDSVPFRGQPPREEEPDDDLEPEEQQPLREKPRKKRSKPKKSSAGLMIGLVAGGAVVILLVLGGGGWLLWYSLRNKAIPDTEWQTFTPPGGDCTVLMPGTPQFQPMTSGGNKVNMYRVTRTKEKGFFVVAFANYGPDPVPPNVLETGVNLEREQIQRTLSGKMTSETSITLGSLPGRELQFATQPRGTIIERVYLAKIGGIHRMYLVVAAGDNMTPNDADAARFFASFQIDGSAQPPTFGKVAAPGRPNPPQANPQPNPPAGIRKPRSPRRQRP